MWHTMPLAGRWATAQPRPLRVRNGIFAAGDWGAKRGALRFHCRGDEGVDDGVRADVVSGVCAKNIGRTVDNFVGLTCKT